MITKWVEANDLSSGQYSAGKNIRFTTSMLRSNLCDYSDAYIVVKGRMNVRDTNNANIRNKKLTFKNNAPFRSYMSKVNNTFIDNAELLCQCIICYSISDNYSKTSGILWNYFRDEVNDSVDEKVNLLDIRQ